ncbi:hypothetical protein BCD48_36405 [Pseudofrankia sp. BMG5.36]|nr:hypothetical protein BCD48_36405 [Pseudofrankia sp. BMG5.36]
MDLACGNTTSRSHRVAALALLALIAAIVVHGILCAVHESHGLPADHHPRTAVALSAPDVTPEAHAGEPSVAADSPEIQPPSPMLWPGQDHLVVGCPSQFILPARLDAVAPASPVVVLLGLAVVPVLWAATGARPGPAYHRGRVHAVTRGLFMRICVLRN